MESLAADHILPAFVRERDHLKVYNFDSSKDGSLRDDDPQDPLPLPTPKVAVWSPDGSGIALVDPAQGVQVLNFPKDAGQATELVTLSGSSKTAQGIQWSPLGSHFFTISPAGPKGSQEPNVHVWQRGGDAPEGWTNSASFVYGKLERDKKVLQWTNEETLCGRLCPDGQIHLLAGADVSGAPLLALSFDHPAQSFAFAPLPADGSFLARLAVFTPDQRDDLQRVVGPAEVTIWNVSGTSEGPPKAEKCTAASVASGQLAELLWSFAGTALLAHCQTEVDDSGQSYYGSTRLMFVSHDGRVQRDLTETDASAQGTSIQAVAWSPVRDEFILIQGFQPAQTSLWAWDEKGGSVAMAKILLEKAHRNTIRFNPFGTLVCLAGFGNLAGQIDFFGRTGSGRGDYQRISQCQANCTVNSEWAPDGRHFMTAVLAPRMRVDNAMTIWRALDGTNVSTQEFEELYDAQWRPEPLGSEKFPAVPLEEVDRAAKALASTVSTEAAQPKRQAYRPPRARGGDENATVAAMMRGELAAPDEDRRRKPKGPIATKEREDHKEAKERARHEAAKEEESYTQQRPAPAQQQRQAYEQHQPREQQPTMAQQRQSYEHQQREQQAASRGYGQQQQQHHVAGAGGYGQQMSAQQMRVPESGCGGRPVAHGGGVQAQAGMSVAGVAGRVDPLGAAFGHSGASAPKDRFTLGSAGPGGGAAQQSLGATTHTHGEKLPCPATGWQYVDPKKNIQGPFTLHEMQQWNMMGYFKPELPMRWDPNDPFVPFAELFPHPLIPFQSHPRRKGAKR